MIFVLLSNGDNAEAPDPAAALFAARILMGEAVDAGASPRITASFYVGGGLVRANVSRSSIAVPATEGGVR